MIRSSWRWPGCAFRWAWQFRCRAAPPSRSSPWLAALWLAHATRFGRTVYAIGGNARSAALMGLPVGATLMRVYAMSGFCAALAGLTMTVYMLSGYSLHAVGLELDAIAAVVIGGTLLTGGVGYVAGTVVGVLILGIIQTLVIFNGTLSSWWTRIVVGILLFLFCVAQRLIEGSTRKPTRTNDDDSLVRSAGRRPRASRPSRSARHRAAGRSTHLRRDPAAPDVSRCAACAATSSCISTAWSITNAIARTSVRWWAASAIASPVRASTLDGATHQVTANEGANHLHGGALGFGKRVWRVLDMTESEAPRVVLGYLLARRRRRLPRQCRSDASSWS